METINNLRLGGKVVEATVLQGDERTTWEIKIEVRQRNRSSNLFKIVYDLPLEARMRFVSGMEIVIEGFLLNRRISVEGTNTVETVIVGNEITVTDWGPTQVCPPAPMLESKRVVSMPVKRK